MPTGRAAKMVEKTKSPLVKLARLCGTFGTRPISQTSGEWGQSPFWTLAGKKVFARRQAQTPPKGTWLMQKKKMDFHGMKL